MYLLFTTTACPNCPRAKTILEDSGVGFKLVDASSPDGLEQAQKLNIYSVPTLVEIDSEDQPIRTIDGIDRITSFTQSIC